MGLVSYISTIKVMPILLSISRLFFIGFCALAMLMQTRMILELPLSPGLLDGYVLGGSIFGYHCTHPDWRYRSIAWGAGLAGAISFVCWAKSFTDVLIALIPMFFWLAYYGFRRPGNAGLRTRLLAKPLTVAFAWAWVTVFMPISIEAWYAALPMFLARGAFVFALALAYDVSDIGYDRRYGLRTLALTMEAKGIYWLIYLSLAISGLFVCLGWASGVYSLLSSLSLFISLFFSAWWIPLLLKNDAWKSCHKVFIDALMLIQCALVLLLR